jgi:hypothetical protein
MMAPVKSILIVGLALVALLSGCAAMPQIKARMVFASPEAALAHVMAGMSADVTVQALADLRMATQEGLHPMKLAVLMKKPESLRVEALPLFGPPVFFLSIHEQRLKVYLSETRTFHTGRASAENIARYLPLKMDPQDLIAVLMGTGPLSSGPDTLLRGRAEGDYYRLDMDGPSKKQSLWIRTTDGFLERLDLHQDRNRSYQVRYEEPLHEEDWVFPQKINIDFGGGDGFSLSIRYRDVRFLKQADPVRFDLAVPPGAAPVYLD